MSCAYCKRMPDRMCGDCRLRLCPGHGSTHYGTATADDECPATPFDTAGRDAVRAAEIIVSEHQATKD